MWVLLRSWTLLEMSGMAVQARIHNMQQEKKTNRFGKLKQNKIKYLSEFEIWNNYVAHIFPIAQGSSNKFSSKDNIRFWKITNPISIQPILVL